MTGHDEHEKKSQYSENNDDVLCPVSYCTSVSPNLIKNDYLIM